MKYWTPILIIILTISGCQKREHLGIYDHGRLEYKITYLNADQGNFDPALLPRKMILEFNEDYCTNTIDGFMGMFRLGNLTYFSKKKSITYLKVLDKNYIFNGGRNELMCCFEMFDGMVIEEDTLTNTIAGLNSKHAKALIPGTNETYDIYYTHDITLKHPNITNPYKDINGVLTDFVLYMGPYKMRFEANKFNPDKSPKENLKIPDSAIKLTREEMIYALDRLMN
jgi:hypothetical protein